MDRNNSLSAVILTKTDSDAMFSMTMDCVRTLLLSVPTAEIIIVESNKAFETSGFAYPENVKVLIPKDDFNFHKFLNVGIKVASGTYIGLFNNDLLFDAHWFDEILKVANVNKDILSFSPVGNREEAKPGKAFEVGYKVMTHVKGWCLVAHKSVFRKTGLLDETFDFYFADNDYAMTLKCYGIKHAVVYGSLVTHLEKKSTPVPQTDRTFLDRYKIPAYLRQPKYDWVLYSEKNLSGFLKFHDKWGNPDWLYKKNRIADILLKNHLGYFVRFFFKI